MFVEYADAVASVPDYVKSHKSDDVFNLEKAPFAFLVGHEGKTYYEIRNLDPTKSSLWNVAVQRFSDHPPYTGIFPFKKYEAEIEKEPERPFVVDIGGGRGQALLAIKRHLKSSVGGRFIFQDLPAVLESFALDDLDSIGPMPYSSFTPQPIRSSYLPACMLIARLKS